ncbi:MAG: trypsin-like peptidase domain-containing protein [Phycisphaerae bacterium]|jgi:serine protease Do|nr:trypsin-like peptidase domain-containing protein [Phycisphaerae bacterium]HOO16876.1 trypsin-like peptidase domain-containing protein [Phycisphaerae bacterium]HPC21900.1 trypsin-like peptidase domain-containing protein [Phycisphaerae bacterium]HRS27713.1 trypsin-like peptidase domain-containing protein [Phycisphaerae bacterium]HRT41996.1 trypsin-like peptidase domain-containing protein [Phycisphaerae bacterium]
MPIQHSRFTTIRSAALIAVITVSAYSLIPLSRAAEPTQSALPAQDALTPSELAHLETLSNSFRKLARLSRRGVVYIVVESAKSAEPDPDLLDYLRQRFAEVVPDEQLQELARRIPGGSGTGIIFDRHGHILTNSHVVRERDEIEVRLPDERVYPAKLVGVDTKTDVAVVKIDAPDLHPLTFADSDQAEVGDWVLAVGAPFGLTQTVTHGIISATGRGHIRGLDSIYYQNFIQTDAAINPGNSGGPLLNMRGEVLGINTAIATDDNRNAGVAFAIPSNMALKIARILIEKGVVSRGWLGISFAPAGVTSADMEILDLPHDRGVLVSSVLAKSPALAAGVQVDDYITGINGQELNGAGQFTNLMGDFLPDTQLTLQVFRDGRKQDIDIRLAQQPDNPNDRSLLLDAAQGRYVPQLGLSGRALRPKTVDEFEADDRGVFVTHVDEDGPCATAVRSGEVITAVNDRKIRNLAELEAALNKPALLQRQAERQDASGAGPREIRLDILQKDYDQRLETVSLP